VDNQISHFELKSTVPCKITFLHDVLYLAQRAAGAGATCSAIVQGRFNLLRNAQRSSVFLSFFWSWRGARGQSAQRAVHMVKADFC
ncbi:hypothetical protein A2U01_0070631, partial [Trifolium medium]|nr:hypothetical protein [Trifolium medium]